MAKKKFINKFLGMNEEGNPYGLKFFINIGSFLFFVLLLIAVAIPQPPRNFPTDQPEVKELNLEG